MHPPDLIKTANELVAANKGKPRQASLHRATSTTYYALFHTLAKCCADMLVGTASSQRSKPAWLQVYRALNHTKAKQKCDNDKVVVKFPNDIQDFANVFVSMQIKRHTADYDPGAKAFKSAVIADIKAAEDAMAKFNAVPAKDRRAFAVWVLMEERKG